MSDQSASNQDSSGFAAGLVLGLIIGGAGGYLLATDKGQELLTKLKEEAGDKWKDFVDNPALSDKLADLEHVMQQARQVVNQTATKVADATEPPARTPKKNFFQRMGSSLGK